MSHLLAREKAAVEAALERHLGRLAGWPHTLHEAMAYALAAGGKRIRPILARLANRAAGGDPDRITDAACGLEMIHTYSLVHDDLPAMDDDVLRRGRPTVHVAWNEATAILVGDALLAEGLLVLARWPEGDGWSQRRAACVDAVAEAVSSRGMVGGQIEDLAAADGPVEDPEGTLERIHRHKTGCLLRASVEVGAILAGVSNAVRADYARFGANLGLAFQIADDILDATGTADQIGKSPGKDEADGKLTYVTLYGLDAARSRLDLVEEELLSLARELEGPDGELAEIVCFVSHRSH